MKHQKKNYQQLDLDSLKEQGWLRYLFYLYKIVSTKQPPHLYENRPLLQSLQPNPGCFKPFNMSNWTLSNFFLNIYYLWMEQIGSWPLERRNLFVVLEESFSLYKAYWEWHLQHLWSTWYQTSSQITNRFQPFMWTSVQA